MNTKETLKRLHKKFPMMGLDELFEILDCYVEEYKIAEPKIWTSTYPLKTNGIEINKNQITCSTSNTSNRNYGKYDDEVITTSADFGTLQFTADH